MVYGPHSIRIDPSKVWKLKDKRILIEFKPDKSYVLTNGDNSVQLGVRDYTGLLRVNK